MTIALLSAAVISLASMQPGAAQPNAVPANDVRWALEAQVVGVGTVTTRGNEGPGTYLYMVVDFTNKNGRDVPLKPSIQVDTDVRGRSYRASFDATVKKAVEKSRNEELKSWNEVRGTIGDGKTVRCIATFGRIDPQVDRFFAHMQGLKDRVFEDNYKTWVEDLALTLEYRRTGDEFYRQFDLLKFVRRSWTTEKDRKELVRRR